MPKSETARRIELLQRERDRLTEALQNGYLSAMRRHRARTRLLAILDILDVEENRVRFGRDIDIP